MNNEMRRNAGIANLPFGSLIIQALKRLGVQHFVISPGSRSTPLTLAVSDLGKDACTVCLDERSAAFYALGFIKATRKPVALVCTSGTAGAHYFPAVIEARQSGLPLIVLTADRPPELQHCHAGQTIEQEGLFGRYPLFQAALPLPEMDTLLMRQVRELCRRTVEYATGWPMGPVHLNCPFREPFFMDADSSPEGANLEEILSGLEPVAPVFAKSTTDKVTLPERTLILAGPRPWMEPEGELAGLLELSKRHGWPILADGVNPLRYVEPEGATVLTHHDQIVRDDALWECLKPEAVILWGEPPTSKILRQRLKDMDIAGCHVGSGKMGMNPFHGSITWLGGTVQSALGIINGGTGSYSSKWAEADGSMNLSMEKALSQPHDLFEGDVHRKLVELLPEGAHVFFTNSLAIRDAEWFMPTRKERLYPFSQRGANGIDGTLSIARGIASGCGQPVYLVTGDLAFLHDSNGFLGAGHQEPGVFVVLLNNSGGGIFELLPVARRSDHFEQVFATPQDVDFSKLVEAHGGRHSLCKSLDALEIAMNEWDRRGLCVVEIPIDRKASADLHREFLKGKKEA